MKNQIIVISIEDLEALIDRALGKALKDNGLVQGKAVMDVMNVEEASAFLNLSITAIYDKTSKKLLPHKKRGRRLYFLRSELEQWILDGHVKTRQEIDQQVMDLMIKK